MKGKVALVTGAARGLGRAFAVALLNDGVKVCLLDIDPDVGLRTEEELQAKYSADNVFFFKCDVTSTEQFEDAMAKTKWRLGGLDIIVNNAGIANENDWKKMMEINLAAVINCTLLGLEQMENQELGRAGGVIINVASVAGVLENPQGPMYAASKHGVVGLSRSLGLVSPRNYGVRVNCICPSFTSTRLMDNIEEAVFDGDGVPNNIVRQRRLVEKVTIMEPEEVAAGLRILIEDKKLSGAVMLVTPGDRRVLNLPMTIPAMFDTYSKL